MKEKPVPLTGTASVALEPSGRPEALPSKVCPPQLTPVEAVIPGAIKRTRVPGCGERPDGGATLIVALEVWL